MSESFTETITLSRASYDELLEKSLRVRRYEGERMEAEMDEVERRIGEMPEYGSDAYKVWSAQRSLIRLTTKVVAVDK
jgi:hypothetical protein